LTQVKDSELKTTSTQSTQWSCPYQDIWQCEESGCCTSSFSQHFNNSC